MLSACEFTWEGVTYITEKLRRIYESVYLLILQLYKGRDLSDAYSKWYSFDQIVQIKYVFLLKYWCLQALCS